MALIALTIAQPTETGWTAITDRGELVEVPAAAVAPGLHPALGQRVVASTDDEAMIVAITIGGTGVGLPTR